MKVCCSSIKTVIADCNRNTEMICDRIDAAAQEKCDIVCFSELSVTGYSCGDMFYNESLIKASKNGLRKIINYSLNVDIVIVVGTPYSVENMLFNCACIIYKGELKGIVPKTYIPNSRENYEKRWFFGSYDATFESVSFDGNEVPFGQPMVIKLNEDIRLGIEIGEDLSAANSVSSMLSSCGANVIMNLSASKETVTSIETRKKILTGSSLQQRVIYIYNSGSRYESTTDNVFSDYKVIYSCGDIISELGFGCDEDSLISKIDVESVNKKRQEDGHFYDRRCAGNNPFIIHINKDVSCDEADEYNREPFLSGMTPALVSERISILQGYALLKKMEYMKRDKIVIGVSGGLDSTIALLAWLNELEEIQDGKVWD